MHSFSLLTTLFRVSKRYLANHPKKLVAIQNAKAWRKEFYDMMCEEFKRCQQRVEDLMKWCNE